MAITYLLDTNILSEIERMAANDNVVARFSAHRGQIAISAVSWHEILYGYHRLPDSKRKQRVAVFVEKTLQSHFPILPYDTAAAEWFAQERARLSKLGRIPSYPDGQIAAIAVVNNLILVTRNTADFADFVGLRIEDWFAPQ